MISKARLGQPTPHDIRFGLGRLSKLSTLIIAICLTFTGLPALAEDLHEATLVEAPTVDAIPTDLPDDPKLKQPYLDLSIESRQEFLRRRAQILSLVSRMANKSGSVAAVGYATHRVRRVLWARKGNPRHWDSLQDYKSQFRDKLVKMVDDGLWLSAQKLVDSDRMNVVVGPRFGLAVQVGPLKLGRFINFGVQYQRDLRGRPVVAASFFIEIEKYKEALVELKGMKIFGRELKGLGIVFAPSTAFRAQGEFRVNDLKSRKVDGVYTYTPAPVFLTSSERAAGAGGTIIGVPFVPPPFGALMPYRTNYVRWAFPFRRLKCVDVFAP